MSGPAHSLDNGAFSDRVQTPQGNPTRGGQPPPIALSVSAASADPHRRNRSGHHGSVPASASLGPLPLLSVDLSACVSIWMQPCCCRRALLLRLLPFNRGQGQERCSGREHCTAKNDRDSVSHANARFCMRDPQIHSALHHGFRLAHQQQHARGGPDSHCCNERSNRFSRRSGNGCIVVIAASQRKRL